MFINTQQSHTIASAAYKQPYVRTGYEFVIGKRTSKLFSTAAEDNGTVTGLTEKGMIVTYDNGQTDGIELGRVYGRAEGTTYPSDVVTPFKLNEKFKKGDILAYNTKFFEPDFIDPKLIVMKMAGTSSVAFMETNQTHEDSCSISENFGARFKTEITKVKSYVVDFTQNILELKKPGETVDPKDILMIIEDEITAVNDKFSTDSLSTLKRLGNVAPRSGVRARVEKIKVFYNGDKRDMSQTLRRIADKSDNDIVEASKSSNSPVVTGRVSDEYRVNGTPLELDKAEIQIYLTVISSTGVGDKVVFGHQMKSTISEVHQGLIHTEDGQAVDSIFSYGSIARRGALSPALLGTTIVLLDAIGKQAATIYLGDA